MKEGTIRQAIDIAIDTDEINRIEDFEHDAHMRGCLRAQLDQHISRGIEVVD